LNQIDHLSNWLVSSDSGFPISYTISTWKEAGSSHGDPKEPLRWNNYPFFIIRYNWLYFQYI
jgi:hypothetical protein